jgi:hypothetical protein
MKMFKNLTKAVLNVAVTPIAVAADIVTLGGAMTERDKPYTMERLEDAKKCLDKAIKPEEE